MHHSDHQFYGKASAVKAYKRSALKYSVNTSIKQLNKQLNEKLNNQHYIIETLVALWLIVQISWFGIRMLALNAVDWSSIVC